MKTAIMQPTYLPWIGYFHMIRQVDLFTFLDDVQFARRSWQQRNRIMLRGSEHFLTIPVSSKGRRDQLIMDVIVDDGQHWRDKHKITLSHAYRRHPFGSDIIDVVGECLDRSSEKLSDITIAIITALCDHLHISTPLQRSSDLPVSGTKSGYLLALCSRCGASEYVSARGSREYIEEEALFAQASIAVEYHDFLPVPYRQVGASQFIPYMSAVDVIANIGFEGAAEMISGKDRAASAQAFA